MKKEIQSRIEKSGTKKQSNWNSNKSPKNDLTAILNSCNTHIEQTPSFPQMPEKSDFRNSLDVLEFKKWYVFYRVFEFQSSAFFAPKVSTF